MLNETTGAQPNLHDGLPEALTIQNLASGAVGEMFAEALSRVAANIADPNTEPTKKRRIVITLDLEPYKDRTGAQTSVSVETKLAGIRPAETSVYFAERGGKHLAFGRNTKQTEIQFGMTEPATAQETAQKN